MGNIYAKRDWGHAKDYTHIQWRILQQKIPDDYVVATGNAYTVKHFFNECCKYLNFHIVWKGKGFHEKAFIKEKGKLKLLVIIDKKYFRPLDINFLRGNPSKAFRTLKFKLKYDLKSLVKEMVDNDLELAKKNNV